MKAISLWQPWASEMAEGRKRIETRSWPTNYRGELAIHAAKRMPSLQEFGGTREEYELMKTIVPFGAIVCVVNLFDCLRTETIRRGEASNGQFSVSISDMEYELGNYSSNRYGWITKDLRKLKTPVRINGRQGFWNLDSETEAQIRKQL